jgi:elongation factor 1 alpha-like protein
MMLWVAGVQRLQVGDSASPAAKSSPAGRATPKGKQTAGGQPEGPPIAGKPKLHMVVVGHVDAGKSTLMGRLLHDLG